MMLFLGGALAGGLLVDEALLMAWDDGGVALYDRETLELQRRLGVTELKPHPASYQAHARVKGAAVWGDSFWVLMGTPGQTWVVQVDELEARPMRSQEQIGGLVGSPQGLLLVVDLGRLVLAEAWEVDGAWAKLVQEHRGERPEPALRSAGDLTLADPGVFARTADGLVVVQALSARGDLLDAEVLVGASRHPVHGFGVLPGQRMLTWGPQENGTVLERWSLFSVELSWPFSLGELTLPERVAGIVTLPEGLWLLTEGPRQELLPGVAVGGAAENHHAGALVDGRVLLVDRGLRLHEVDPPSLHPEQPGAPQEGPISQALVMDDLPLGEDNAPGGSMPTYVEHNIDRLVELASPLKRFPLQAAQRYLDDFPDPERQAVVDARRDEIERSGTALAFILAIALALGTWLWRWGRRKIVQRDRTLAAHFNPFRQDSPNNPSRTPFAATELVGELLRALELNCVVVQGPELTGKSALLRHLAWRMTTEGLAGKEVRVVRLELVGIPERRFWTELGRAVAAVYPECEASAELLEEDEDLDRDAVEYLLDEALECGPQLVLILDDLDTLGLYRHESQRFRGLMQIVPSHRMAVLGAGMNIRRGFGDHDESPWFNLFQVRNLRPMDEEELAEYLHRRLQAPFSFEGGVPRRLHELTGGRALQVWHICSTAAEELLVTRRVVLRVADLDDAADALRDMAGMVVPGDDEAWAGLLTRVADARRRREVLLGQLAERRQVEQAELLSAFFTTTDSTE